MNNIHLKKGDITRADTDAIVNAANSVMLGGGGVDGAIHRAAGPRLLEACQRVPATNGIRCPAGEACITPGFDLDAKWVIHTVGPRYQVDEHPEKLLASAYSTSLELALAHECKSIGFPAISCGAYGYPLEEAASVAIGVCSQEKWKELDITFYLFDSRTYSVWLCLLEKYALQMDPAFCVNSFYRK